MAAGDSDVGRSSCDTRTPLEILTGRPCEIGDKAAKSATFAVIGDSFAISLRPAVDSAALHSGEKGVSLTKGGCYPLMGAVQFDDYQNACGAFFEAVVTYLHEHPTISKVILIARWTSAAEGTSAGAEHMFITDQESVTRSYEENRRVFVRSLERTIRALSGRMVFVVLTIPEHFIDVPRIAALGQYFGWSVNVDLPRTDLDRRQKFVRDTLVQMSDRLSFHMLDLSPYLCDQQRCLGVRDGNSLYADSDHLSRFGALSIRDVFLPVFQSP
jgi:SGNH domain (fused to AT3 domains)